jgi:peptidoglycan/LPS O-acetylase OafA/YrhL
VPAPAAPSHFRADVQGLRAVAVGLVLLDHVLGWPHGGFIGVDVFFVISGFLITGLLVRERERTGRISYRAFYARRARRILPAALAVLVVTDVAAWALFIGDRAQQIVGDSLWAFFFAANINSARQGTDYFQATAQPSPFQHFWSLSVEEQFYLVWPALILAVLALVRGRRRGVALGAVMLAVSVASLMWSIHATAASPTTAYFSTFTRAWELGVGALVAVAATQLRRLPQTFRAAMAWTGLVGIVVAAFTITPETPFPGTAAAFPVLCTAAVLAFGDAARGPKVGWMLGSGVMQYLGNISYSLYLWHWPVLILLAGLTESRSIGFDLLVIAISVAMAALSYLVVEQPVLHSGWLLPTGRPGDDESRQVVFRKARYAGLAATGLVVLTVFGVFPVLFPPGRLDAQTVAQLNLAYAEELAAAEKDGPAEVLTPEAAEIKAALEVTSWGELNPGLDDLSAARAPEWVEDNCLDVNEANVDDCRYGSAKAAHRAVVLGDSVAVSWMPGLRAAMEPAGWSLQSMTWHQCPNITAPTLTTDGGANTDCSAHRDWALQELDDNPPDLVVLSDSLRTSLADERADTTAVWESGATDVMTRLVATKARVVVLSSPPTAGDLRTCVTNFSTPASCIGKISSGYEKAIAAERAAATAAGVTFVETRDWFCYKSRCPAVVGDMPVYVDSDHLTRQYSKKLAPQLAQAILTTG